MSNRTPSNFSASAYAKLKNIAGTHGWNFMHLLIRYATERFLYRLSVSPYAEQFVLKGGNLFVIWQNGQNYRPTIDSDLLCFGNAGEQHLQTIFMEMCRSTACVNDGMSFDADSIEISVIREDTEYGGTRLVFNAYLGQARIRLQFDIGIGDSVTPAPELAEYPPLLGHPAPKLKIYPMASAIAEKAEAMVSRGLLNSRMKDFYDVWLLSELFDHDYVTLVAALRNTFERRNVPRPSVTPGAWTEEFAGNPAKVIQWRAFLRKNSLDAAPKDFSVTVARIAAFLRPVCIQPNTPLTVWIAAHGWR